MSAAANNDEAIPEGWAMDASYDEPTYIGPDGFVVWLEDGRWVAHGAPGMGHSITFDSARDCILNLEKQLRMDDASRARGPRS